MSNNLIEKINEGLEILDDAGKIAGHGILHNHTYREVGHRQVLSDYLSGIERSKGNHGPDATYGKYNVELKSRWWDVKYEPTIEKWENICFSARNKEFNKLYKIDYFGHGMFRRRNCIPIANFLITQDHIHKIHPLFDQKIDEFKRSYPNKDGGRMQFEIELHEILNFINEKDIIWFRHGKQVETMLL